MGFVHIQLVVNLLMAFKNYVVELDIRNIKLNFAEIFFPVSVNMVLGVNFCTILMKPRILHHPVISQQHLQPVEN
jgi:hypothetical protein